MKKILCLLIITAFLFSFVACGNKESNGSNNYAVAVFTLLGDFTGDKLAEVKAYATVARAGIKEMLEQRAINYEELKEPTDSFTEIIEEGNEPSGDPFSVVEN